MQIEFKPTNLEKDGRQITEFTITITGVIEDNPEYPDETEHDLLNCINDSLGLDSTAGVHFKTGEISLGRRSTSI